MTNETLLTPRTRADRPPRPRNPWWRTHGFKTAIKFLTVAAIAGLLIFKVRFAPTPVVSGAAAPATIVGEVLGSGTLEARVQTSISPKISGRIDALFADQNDHVAAGILLARLDDAEMKQQVEIAKASLSAARAGVERAAAEEHRAQAVLGQAQLDNRRTTELLSTRVASTAEADKTRELLHIAEADLKRAQAAVVEVERQVQVAEQTLAYHEERWSDTRIEAPFDGLIVKRHREPGDVVVPGSAVLTLASTNELWISAWVDESAMAALAPQQQARVVFRSEPTRSYPGEVIRLGRQTDPETREFLVDVRVNELPVNWALGQRAEVFIETQRKDAPVALAPEFIHWREGLPGVFVAAHGKAQWRPVELGMRSTRSVEIVSGIVPGERVVKSANAKSRELTDGVRIKGS